MEDVQMAVDVAREALWVAMKVAAPLLLVSLVVGVLVGIVQAATQIQEQSLTLIPKMVAVMLTLFVLLPWLLFVLAEYTENVVTSMGHWFP